jgi:Arc/MetJ-type ribon-helix-helix transcriptional regulator
MKRVTVTLPDAIVEEIDRWEKNRSKFVLEATERELNLRRNRELERSLRNPHPESTQVAEAGIEDWGDGWAADDEELVDPSAGRLVQWTPDGGWREGSE